MLRMGLSIVNVMILEQGLFGLHGGCIRWGAYDCVCRVVVCDEQRMVDESVESRPKRRFLDILCQDEILCCNNMIINLVIIIREDRYSYINTILPFPLSYDHHTSTPATFSRTNNALNPSTTMPPTTQTLLTLTLMTLLAYLIITLTILRLPLIPTSFPRTIFHNDDAQTNSPLRIVLIVVVRIYCLCFLYVVSFRYAFCVSWGQVWDILRGRRGEDVDGGGGKGCG